MRPRWSTMLQHNNNNNYPCLSSSPREAPLKCSSASLPLPSRLELGLGDLPLIRGLRAWALCSKNRQKGGAPVGGGQAPATPPAGLRTSCSRPADVHLSRGWGRTGYGLPLDARQSGIGALVTVATLKTSEGNGKTQTQCLFVRNDKGSCLYSTAKPASGGTTGAGGWLRGKSGAVRRDDASTLQTENSSAVRGRVRSGRRWRKSGHAAGREKRGKGEEPEEEAAKKQEVGLERLPGSEQHDGGGCQDSERLPWSPGFCQHDSSTQVEEDGLRGGVPTRLSQEKTPMKKQREEEEEEEDPLRRTDILEGPDPDLESIHSQAECGGSKDSNMKGENQDVILPTGEEEEGSEVTGRHTEPSHPAGDSTCKAESEVLRVERVQGNAELERTVKLNTTRGHVDDNGHLEGELSQLEVQRGDDGVDKADWTLKGRKEGGVSPVAPRLHNPVPTMHPTGTMATTLPRVDAEEEDRGPDGRELAGREEKHGEEEEENDFGVFMQAEGGAAWSEGVAMSAPVPCGSSVAFEESSDWKPTWTGSSTLQSGDAWTAFPQDEGQDGAGQWWPEEERRDRDDDHNLAGLFASAFPSLPDLPSCDPGDPDVFPTLTQLLGRSSGQEQRLLDGFHDFSKMIVHRYKRGSGGVSRELLLRSLRMEQPSTDSRPVTWWANRRPSPGLHSSNQHAHSASAKRRLSCDYNRSVTD
ncbi:uncharacterized protein si:ch211-14c7.2 [Dunckerocampus dactyliophorus]|uniref:uncharacterized protein si:ch211-14c7.2 n=1 Tax=Dunckerocampus dactyliophorus TaxID=161453 RepID=UPI002404A363|nr:uncharacterized protein si:ch211-14c7.2 [Dunckerocampus dactyliophorus]